VATSTKLEISSILKIMESVVKAFIKSTEEGSYVAECYNLPVVTQGETLDEVAANLREAIALALEGDFKELGFRNENPPIIVTLELPTLHAA
jgi:predicted RNase H-like HicB family nuclease